MLLPEKRCRVAQAVPVILNTAKNLNSHPTELLAGHRGTAGLLELIPKMVKHGHLAER